MRRDLGLVLLIGLLTGCPGSGSPPPLPPPPPRTPPPTSPDPTPPPVPAPPPGPAPAPPVAPAPDPDPIPPARPEEPAVNLSLDEMLEELAQIEDMGIDFDDSMGDYERRLERPRVLFAEARERGFDVDTLVQQLVALRTLPEGLGHVRRPWLAQLLAQPKDGRGIDAVGGAMRKLNAAEVAEIVHQLPEDEAFAGIVGRWFRSLSGFARTTGSDASESQRLALIEAYAERKGPADALRPLVAEDPSPKVKARAAELLQ